MPTVRFRNELERTLTIKLGYGHASMFKCEEVRWARPMAYKAYGSGKEDSPLCDVPDFESARMKLLRHVSFVDCPVSGPGVAHFLFIARVPFNKYAFFTFLL
jgi:translation initiation factor 2 subunit 3